MRRIIPLLLFLYAPVALAQQAATGDLIGHVLDAASGAPVAEADLYIAQLDRRATSDSTGAYRFSDVRSGVFDMQVRRLGFAQITRVVSVITGAESEIDIRLKRIVTLDTVHTKAAAVAYISPALRGFEERKKMGFGYFIDEALMRKNDNRTLGNTLRRIPGIVIIETGSSELIASGRRSGSGKATSRPPPCFAAVYLDGVAIYTGPPQTPPDLTRTPVRELAAAEFYHGGATLPVQFAAIKNSSCGVLLLWTRER